MRGNLDTRLKKLETEDVDAIVLAAAGVKRLGYESRITQFFDKDFMLPAVGQGALCIETRENDSFIKPVIDFLDHKKTRIAVMGERSFLKRLEGGCQVPIAAYAIVDKTDFHITGLVASVDGTRVIRESLSGSVDMAESTGIELANILISLGAKSILDNIKI